VGRTSEIKSTTSELTGHDTWQHVKARLGYHRMNMMVEPGLYALGRPKRNSPVFVSANYQLSLDALRSNLGGVDSYILVINTHGINVWCAAGKGTFGTDEVVRSVSATDLADVVDHRVLILPQLGAPGVSAQEVRKRTGFRVEYGPVRAEDVPEYLRLGHATAEMRTVKFPLRDRATLVPVEVVRELPLLVTVSLLLYFTVGLVPSLMAVATLLAGMALFPLFLPHIPTKDFASKGLVLGLMVSLPFAWLMIPPGASVGKDIAYAVLAPLFMAPIVSFLALGFTGSSTYASRTCVRREIYTYIPVMAILLIGGAALLIGIKLIEAAAWI
jgi:hypothetical protein